MIGFPALNPSCAAAADAVAGRSNNMKKPLPNLQTDDLRIPKRLLDAVKAAAASAGIPYQRYIRQTLEVAVRRPRKET
jgi:hypothetical protein